MVRIERDRYLFIFANVQIGSHPSPCDSLQNPNCKGPPIPAPNIPCAEENVRWKHAALCHDADAYQCLGSHSTQSLWTHEGLEGEVHGGTRWQFAFLTLPQQFNSSYLGFKGFRSKCSYRDLLGTQEPLGKLDKSLALEMKKMSTYFKPLCLDPGSG